MHSQEQDTGTWGLQELVYKEQIQMILESLFLVILFLL